MLRASHVEGVSGRSQKGYLRLAKLPNQNRKHDDQVDEQVQEEKQVHQCRLGLRQQFISSFDDSYGTIEKRVDFGKGSPSGRNDRRLF